MQVSLVYISIYHAKEPKTRLGSVSGKPLRLGVARVQPYNFFLRGGEAARDCKWKGVERFGTQFVKNRDKKRLNPCQVRDSAECPKTRLKLEMRHPFAFG